MKTKMSTIAVDKAVPETIQTTVLDPKEYEWKRWGVTVYNNPNSRARNIQIQYLLTHDLRVPPYAHIQTYEIKINNNDIILAATSENNIALEAYLIRRIKKELPYIKQDLRVVETKIAVGAPIDNTE